MSEELQSLLDKINADGIQKAEAESARIIAAAKADARFFQLPQDAAAAACIAKQVFPAQLQCKAGVVAAGNCCIAGAQYM